MPYSQLRKFRDLLVQFDEEYEKMKAEAIISESEWERDSFLDPEEETVIEEISDYESEVIWKKNRRNSTIGNYEY